MVKSLKKVAALVSHEMAHRRRTREAPGQDAKVRAALSDLRSKGYHIVERYWTEQLVREWSEKMINHSQKTGDNDLVRAGGIRWQYLERDYPQLEQLYARDKFILDVVDAYQADTQLRKITYQRSYPDQKLVADQSVGAKIGLGRNWHMDSWTHGLKTIMFLTDIGPDNGPFTYIPASHRFGLNGFGLLQLKKFWPTLPPDPFNSDVLYFTPDEITRERMNEKSVALTGPKGTLAFVDTRGLHQAALIRAGERQVLWNYFS